MNEVEQLKKRIDKSGASGIRRTGMTDPNTNFGASAFVYRPPEGYRGVNEVIPPKTVVLRSTEMEKHKHWYEIMAFAYGWKIEDLAVTGIWYPNDSPSFDVTTVYRVVPDAEGFMPWFNEGDCPTAPNTIVEVCCKNNSRAWETEAAIVQWFLAENPVLKYRVVKVVPKKVKMWQWICETANRPFITPEFYPTEESVRVALRDHMGSIRPALWTETEFEVGAEYANSCD